MPYIKKYHRDSLEHVVSEIRKKFLDVEMSPGELNYLFTVIGNNYINTTAENYQRYNDVIGALESCKLEFYRRSVVPYEDDKIKENGDL